MKDSQQSHSVKGIVRNVLYGFSTWLFPLGLSFIATPLIVRTLGNQDYGIYALVLSLIGYTFNLNFGRAVTKYVAEYRAAGETEKIRDVISASLFINLIFGFSGVILMAASANWLVKDVFQIADTDQTKTVNALYIAALAVFSLIVSQVFSAVLQGIYRFDVYSKIYNFNNLATLAGNLWLAYNGYGLVYLLIWNLLTNFIVLLMYILSVKRLMPEFAVKFRFRTAFLKMLLKYSAGVISYQILGNLLILFERGWITRWLGAENLTFYVVPMSLSFYIQGFVVSIIQIVFPLASELQNSPEKLLHLYRKATKIVCFFVFFLAALLTVQSRLFLTLWMGAEFAEKTYFLLIIHTITFSIVAVQTVSWQMTEGLGYPSYNTFGFMICLTVNVLIITSVTENYGITGIAFGRLISFCLLFFLVFYVEKRFFKAVQISFWFNIVSRLVLATTFSSIVQFAIVNRFNSSWLTFVTATAMGGIIYCGVLWMLGFVTDEDKLMLKKSLSRSNLK